MIDIAPEAALDERASASGLIAGEAARYGLTAWIDDRSTLAGPMYVAVAQRADDGEWTLPATDIALAGSLSGLVLNARAALRAMAPRLQKRLAALPQPVEPQADEVAIAAGIGSDGAITALRVERDGTMRLCSADIDEIVERIVARLRPGQEGEGWR